MASELFYYGSRIFYEKFAFFFCVDAICKQTHEQTHRLVHVSLILIVYSCMGIRNAKLFEAAKSMFKS